MKDDISTLKFENKVISILIGLGILLPLIQYFFNRSLWVDEVTLALNILNAGILALLKPLESGHVVPIIFLLLEKFFSILIPNSEYGFRILPLFSYFASLFFFYKILNNSCRGYRVFRKCNCNLPI